MNPSHVYDAHLSCIPVPQVITTCRDGLQILPKILCNLFYNCHCVPDFSPAGWWYDGGMTDLLVVTAHVKYLIKNTHVCTKVTSSPLLTPEWFHQCTQTLHSVCSHMEIRPSLAMCKIVRMKLGGFQTLLQQCLILCSTLPYSGGRDHGDQRPKARKHEWDQSLWMTSAVRMEIRHHSFRFVCLSGPFYSSNLCNFELCLPHP